MPGRSCTSDRRRRNRRLKSADLPTLGRPATTTRNMPPLPPRRSSEGLPPLTSAPAETEGRVSRSERPAGRGEGVGFTTPSLRRLLSHASFQPEREARVLEGMDIGEAREDPPRKKLLVLLDDGDARGGVGFLRAARGDRLARHREC